MQCKYYICDVFTDKRFGGNQLAVIPDADGLSDEQMQKIAREFNFSESTFVFPPEKGQTKKVRIFTPNREVPFAGHPNIGTSFVLASIGDLGAIKEKSEIIFEEKAGLVPVQLQKIGPQKLWCELQAPEDLSLGKTFPVKDIAAALSLTKPDIIAKRHLPQIASVGLPFIFIELRDKSALERARPNVERLNAMSTTDFTADIHLYTLSGDDFDIRARMFAPLDGIPEDPATGSANCALAGLLAHYDQRESGQFQWKIAQGWEMGRPSKLEARAVKKNGKVTGTWIGGSCVMISEGFLYLD